MHSGIVFPGSWSPSEVNPPRYYQDLHCHAVRTTTPYLGGHVLSHILDRFPLLPHDASWTTYWLCLYRVVGRDTPFFKRILPQNRFEIGVGLIQTDSNSS